jgi:uncharacterized protein GlcG (DUF336 family)
MVEEKERLTKLEDGMFDLTKLFVEIATSQKFTAEALKEVTSNLKEVTKENHNLNNAFVDFRSKVMTAGGMVVLGSSAITFVINYFLKR